MKNLVRFASVLVYSLGYCLLAFDLVGAGHGTIFFLIPLLSWPLLLAAAILQLCRQNRRASFGFFSTFSMHVSITLLIMAAYILSGDDGRLVETVRESPMYCLFTVVWYITGLVIILERQINRTLTANNKLP